MRLAKAFCAQKVNVISYQVANNDGHVKCAFLYILQPLQENQWMTHALLNKVSGKAMKKHNLGDGKSWEPSDDELCAGIAHISYYTPHG